MTGERGSEPVPSADRVDGVGAGFAAVLATDQVRGERFAAVLGSPIGHSLSPVIHSAGYAAAGLTGWSYRAHECVEAGLAGLVAGLDERWAGLSLTMPLKEVALTVADSVEPTARTLGAANTLVRRAEGWHAVNTDAPGMLDALRAAGVESAGQVTILGAGGTARAALAAAVGLGAHAVVVARRVSAVEALRPVSAGLGGKLTATDWSEAVPECQRADVVISTVPKGVADQLATVPWPARTVYFDVLYHPWPTPLAATAQRAGAVLISGLDLLLAQAVRQFELYTGVPAPVEAMRAALAAARIG